MKKRIKKAFFLIGIGVMFMAAGYNMGGSDAVHKIFSTFISGKRGTFFTDKADFLFNCEKLSENLAIIEGKPIKHLYADISQADVKIVPHSLSSFLYTIFNNSSLISASVTAENDSLCIKTKKTGNPFLKLSGNIFGSSLYNTRPVITVNIPEDAVFETAEIHSGTGKLVLEGFRVDKSFILETGVGTANIKNISASNADIKTGVGDSHFSICMFENAKMESGIGKLKFTGTVLNDLTVKSGIGNVELNITDKREEYSVNIDSGIGKVFIDGVRSYSINNKIASDNTSNRKINIETGIGNVNVKFKE